MTLSLDDVRNKRFRMARKSGYEVLEVDEFVDEIEESFASLLEENQNLKKQVEALKSSGGAQVPQPAAQQAPAAPAPAPAQAPTPAPAPVAAASGPSERIVVTTAKEASSAVVRLVELYTEQAEQLVREANQEAVRVRSQASASVEQVTAEARTRAERLEAEARVNAERVNAQVHSRTEQLDREIGARRAELLDNLAGEREQLVATVEELRGFEAAYRSNLTQHLRDQLTTVESLKAEPAGAPAPVRSGGQRGATAAPDPSAGASPDGGPASDTPRLDALLGDQR